MQNATDPPAQAQLTAALVVGPELEDLSHLQADMLGVVARPPATSIMIVEDHDLAGITEMVLSGVDDVEDRPMHIAPCGGTLGLTGMTGALVDIAAIASANGNPHVLDVLEQDLALDAMMNQVVTLTDREITNVGPPDTFSIATGVQQPPSECPHVNNRPGLVRVNKLFGEHFLRLAVVRVHANCPHFSIPRHKTFGDSERSCFQVDNENSLRIGPRALFPLLTKLLARQVEFVNRSNQTNVPMDSMTISMAPTGLFSNEPLAFFPEGRAANNSIHSLILTSPSTTDAVKNTVHKFMTLHDEDFVRMFGLQEQEAADMLIKNKSKPIDGALTMVTDFIARNMIVLALSKLDAKRRWLYAISF